MSERNFKETRCDCINWIKLAQCRSILRSTEHGKDLPSYTTVEIYFVSHT
jgi:hypothetical protein